MALYGHTGRSFGTASINCSATTLAVTGEISSFLPSASPDNTYPADAIPWLTDR